MRFVTEMGLSNGLLPAQGFLLPTLLNALAAVSWHRFIIIMTGFHWRNVSAIHLNPLLVTQPILVGRISPFFADSFMILVVSALLAFSQSND